jgi:solute carrier family 25, member 33/36
VSASYLGVAESVIQFVLYETLKRKYSRQLEVWGTPWPHVGALSMGAASKLIASTITYPHEVVRTRLRQVDGQKYTGILQTLRIVIKEEGWMGLYGGMAAHLLRTVPNAAIMFAIVEAMTDTGI